MPDPLFNVTTRTIATVNFRSTPEKRDDNILRELPTGTSVAVGGNEYEWLLVRHGAQAGYIHMSLVEPFARSDTAWMATVEVNSSLNVRGEPSTGATKIGSLNSGASLVVVGAHGEWLEVRWGTGTAFVKAEYTRAVAASEPSDPASPEPLTAAKIRELRAEIEKLDVTSRGAAYRSLLSVVPYYSQRDNESRDGNGKLVEGETGAMCNLTSLAMCLTYLGMDNPHPDLQFEDALERVRVDEGLPERWRTTGWGGVATSLGARLVFIKLNAFVEGEAWWRTTVSPLLSKGSAVMMSITGHIVRLQDVSEEGLVVDDPYGESRLGAGDRYTFAALNPYQRPGTIVGDGVVWPWADVAEHQMLWLAEMRVNTYDRRMMPRSGAVPPIPEMADRRESNPARYGLPGGPVGDRPSRRRRDDPSLRWLEHVTRPR